MKKSAKKSMTIYQVYSGNIEDSEDSAGLIAWKNKKDAVKVAKECCQDIFNDCEQDDPGKLRIKNTLFGMGFAIVDQNNQHLNWWYVTKVKLIL